MKKQPLPVSVGETIVGWCCGRCGYITTSNHLDVSARFVEHTRSLADACCICDTCGKEIVSGNPETRCAACSSDRLAKMASEQKVTEAAASETWRDAERSHEMAWRFTATGGRAGRLFLVDDGVFSKGFARLDPTEEDPAPRAVSGGFMRSEQRAVYGALFDLLTNLDQHLESLALEPGGDAAKAADASPPERMLWALIWSLTDPYAVADCIPVAIVRGALVADGWTLRMKLDTDEFWDRDRGHYRETSSTSLSLEERFRRDTVLHNAHILAANLSQCSGSETRAIVLAQWLLTALDGNAQ